MFVLLAVASVCVPTAAANAAQADWKKDWEQTLAAAKKEGQVTIYIYRYEGLLHDFKRDFPGINVVSVTGRGNELTNRLMAERRAGRFIADVYSGGTNSLYNTLYKGKALDPLKPLLILPEVTDTSKWYGNEHRYADPEGKYIFSFIGSREQRAARLQHEAGRPERIQILLGRHQSQMERQNRFPRSARHGPGRDHAVLLLQSRDRSGIHEEVFRRHGYYLCEKFSADDRLAGAGEVCYLHGLQGFHARQEPRFAGGRFRYQQMERRIEFLSGRRLDGYVNQAPHPNAAKVFLNWFLSRKGQIALQKLGDVDDPANSRRIDIPKDDIPPDNRLQPGVKYFDVVKPEYGDMKPIFDLAKEIMAGVEKK